MGWHYQAPLADMRFVIERVLGAPTSWQGTEAFAGLDIDTCLAVLEEAARFASEVLLPINAVGDAQGCRIDEQGRVRTPDGFKEAYRRFVDGGWPALPCSPQWGGQGLPMLVDAATREMLSACNHGWAMYPDLLHGAYETLRAHASDRLRNDWLPGIVSGETLAAMALTEPHAGSDLGVLRTRADVQADGSLRVSGGKIFISGGDHDLTDTVVHLVLCRLPDAPPGSKGLSLALVPTVLPDGSRNAVFVDGLEHKMGIHGSATCALRYEGATGWLVGAAHRGLAAMFLMMNSARLHVGLQGLGHQEISMQNALRHAFERVQGRGPTVRTAEPIAHHPAMRHVLLRLQAMTEAQRVIAYRAAMAIDDAAHHPLPAVRQSAGALAGLMTPVVKAFLTHHGFHGASSALQVFGGYGYIAEYGVEQSVRDSRIAMVYEGTNEIQAIDLLQRKVLGDGGHALDAFLLAAAGVADRCEQSGLDEFARSLREACATTREVAGAVRDRSAHDAECVMRVADDFLFGLSYTMLAWAFGASAAACHGFEDVRFAQAKLERMRYGVQWVLPQAEVHWRRVRGGLADFALPSLEA